MRSGKETNVTWGICLLHSSISVYDQSFVPAISRHGCVIVGGTSSRLALWPSRRNEGIFYGKPPSPLKYKQERMLYRL